jgi:hypothetical protein
LVERTVRIREVAGSSPATQTRSTTGHGPMVGLSSDTRAVLVRFQVPRLMLETLPCSWMRLDRSAAVYHVNRVRFPAGALAALVLPPWRRWFARLSEKQEDPVQFRETALLFTCCRPRSGSSLDSKSERAGFNSLAACHALVAQLEEHRFRKLGAVGSIPTGGTRSTEGFCCRGREVRHLSATQDNAGPSPAGSFNGLVVQRENSRFAPERPGFKSRRVHFLVSLSHWFRSSVG